jgi:hypothetical protein
MKQDKGKSNEAERRYERVEHSEFSFQRYRRPFFKNLPREAATA